MSEIQDIRTMTTREFAVMGLDDVAYVKPVLDGDGKAAYAVHEADGTKVAVFDDRDIAFAAVIQGDLEPVDAH